MLAQLELRLCQAPHPAACLAVRLLGVRPWRLESASHIGEDERGNAERQALFVGLWPATLWMIGETWRARSRSGAGCGAVAQLGSPRTWTRRMTVTSAMPPIRLPSTATGKFWSRSPHSALPRSAKSPKPISPTLTTA